MMEFEEFSLLIRRTGSAYYRNFASLEDLKAELSRHLTAQEIKRGALQKLTTFSRFAIKSGYIETNWANMSVCAYLKD